MRENESELQLLAEYGESRYDGSTDGCAHERTTAPLFTYDVYAIESSAAFPQRGVLAGILDIDSPDGVVCNDPRLYVNTNAPLSGVVCGVQGSGKSHTLSVILENYFLRDKRIGEIREALAGVVFHYDSVTGGAAIPPCEAAFVSLGVDGRPAVPVTVLVSPSNLNKMQSVYSNLPVEVHPLRFSDGDITADRLQAMMACDLAEKRPLYMEATLNRMRELGEDFEYASFRRELSTAKWLKGQQLPLEQRLSLLDGYLRHGTEDNCVKSFFSAGRLVVIDLTDPMVDGVTSSGLFDIVLGMFLEKKIEGGKLVVLDEAHKYLTTDRGASRLVDSIQSVIRQQRHLATRTIIATQEPTVISDRILDLVSFIVMHRFSSPAWAAHLKHHVSFVEEGGCQQGGQDARSWFDRVVELRTGEALIFCPAALVAKDPSRSNWKGRARQGSVPIGPLGRGCIMARVRRRVTSDGGASMMSVGGFRAFQRKGSPVLMNDSPFISRAETPAYLHSSRSPDAVVGSSAQPSSSRTSDYQVRDSRKETAFINRVSGPAKNSYCGELAMASRRKQSFRWVEEADVEPLVPWSSKSAGGYTAVRSFASEGIKNLQKAEKGSSSDGGWHTESPPESDLDRLCAVLRGFRERGFARPSWRKLCAVLDEGDIGTFGEYGAREVRQLLEKGRGGLVLEYLAVGDIEDWTVWLTQGTSSTLRGPPAHLACAPPAPPVLEHAATVAGPSPPPPHITHEPTTIRHVLQAPSKSSPPSSRAESLDCDELQSLSPPSLPREVTMAPGRRDSSPPISLRAASPSPPIDSAPISLKTTCPASPQYVKSEADSSPVNFARTPLYLNSERASLSTRTGSRASSVVSASPSPPVAQVPSSRGSERSSLSARTGSGTSYVASVSPSPSIAQVPPSRYASTEDERDDFVPFDPRFLPLLRALRAYENLGFLRPTWASVATALRNTSLLQETGTSIGNPRATFEQARAMGIVDFFSSGLSNAGNIWLTPFGREALEGRGTAPLPGSSAQPLSSPDAAPATYGSSAPRGAAQPSTTATILSNSHAASGSESTGPNSTTYTASLSRFMPFLQFIHQAQKSTKRDPTLRVDSAAVFVWLRQPQRAGLFRTVGLPQSKKAPSKLIRMAADAGCIWTMEKGSCMTSVGLTEIGSAIVA